MERRVIIKWFEWMYEVSNLWNIRSLKNWVICPIKTRKLHLRWWYPIVDLRIWWTYKKTMRVSRLVAQWFLWLNIEDSKTLVCHKDDNVENNKLENLFLWSHQDNSNDCSSKWRTSKPWKWKVWYNSSRWKEVLWYDKEMNLLWIFWSMRQAGIELNIDDESIRLCCKWTCKYAKWYIFRLSWKNTCIS